MAGESQEVPKTGVPDPTVLVTEALTRGLNAERDYTDGEIAVLKERLDGIDRATQVFHETLIRVPTETQIAVGHLKELHAEKFASVETQFKERDTRQEREARDNKVAVDAAFAAQKEAASEQNKSNTLAISKSEVATTETINKLAELFRTTTDGLADKIDDGKDDRRSLEARIGRIESSLSTRRDEKSDQRLNVNMLVGVLGLVLAAAVFAFAFALR